MQSKVFLAAFASFWQVLVATLYGVQDVDPVATDTARSFGFSRSAAPVPGDAAQRGALHRHRAADRLGGVADPDRDGRAGDRRRRASGRAINVARSGGNEELMYALILATGILGLLLNMIFVRAEKRVLHWHPSQRPGRRRRERRAPSAGWRRARGRRAAARAGALGRAVRQAARPTTSRRSPTSSTTFADTWVFERVGSDVVPEPPAHGRRASRSRSWWRIAARAGCSALSPRARRATAPIVEFLRAIPPPALLPFAILVIGVGNSMKVFIIAFVCLWPILLNTIDGVTGRGPDAARDGPRLRDPARDRGAARDAARPPARRSSPACAPACRWR